MHKVFIDGQVGTTGLEIYGRLSSRPDIELLEIDAADRKDPGARAEIMAASDVVILCLPDDAAKEAVSLPGTDHVRFIDASTAHRVDENWAYGFPELGPGQREAIARARCVSNPGCYPTGFLAALRPLLEAGIVKRDSLITINAVSGYSGGGRQLVEKYEAREAMHPEDLWYVRPYALQMKHKHIPEMTHYAGLDTPPAFMPVVGHFHKGMLVSVPLFAGQMTRTTSPDEITGLLADYYADEPCIFVADANDVTLLDSGFLDPQAANGTNRIDLMVFGHEDQCVVIARLDNLGKGASGAAVQNLNLMLQLSELEGLAV